MYIHFLYKYTRRIFI